jgi:uncharacterized protein
MSRSVVPFQQFVLKVHSRCDLACDHCYIYHGHDEGWRDRPMAMTEETARRVGRRIADHARSHRLDEVYVVLHGGEPLLAGVSRLAGIISLLRAEVAGVCELDLRIHTNGVQLNEDFCDLFVAEGVKVGISLDGGRPANDLHRRYLDGRSSYNQVIRAINLLREDRYRDLYQGLLCTIDIRNDPVAVYESLVALEPPRIDFLLPHATWDEPPFRPLDAGAETAYADWLIQIFDRWSKAPGQVSVRLFDSIIRTSRGSGSLTEAIGTTPSNLVVIESDGTYEQADSLKASYEDASKTGFNVFTTDLDIVAGHPGIEARQSGLAGLSAKCRSCEVVSSCGGGLYAHRYRSDNGFDNPSVYCLDLMKLVNHIRANTSHDRSAESGHAHTLADVHYDELAAGYGSADAISHLQQAQYSLARALLVSFHDQASAVTLPEAAQFDLPGAWKTLAGIDKMSPGSFETVLCHPFVRAWAARCLDGLRSAGSGAVDPPASLASDLGHVGSIALAAAIRAGLSASAIVPVRDGSIGLPGLGRLVIAGECSATAAVVETDRDSVSFTVGSRRWSAERTDAAELYLDAIGDGQWQPVRQLTGSDLSVALEDTDAYRDCYGYPVAPRGSADQFTDWTDCFQAAWKLICDEYPGYAPGLAAGLTTIVPLTPHATGREISATARNASGAIATAPVGDPATLALLLIHEFQHVKLGAMIDLYDLFDPADKRLYYAPWRDDRRPLEGLLQGTYAHVAVSDFWRIRMGAGDPGAELAASRYEFWSSHTSTAIEELAASGSLTALGLRLVDRMRETVSSWSL